MTDAGTPWLSDEDETLWRMWLSCQAGHHVAIAQDLRGAALSEPDFEVLVHLTDQPEGGLRMSELADGLQWGRSRVSHQITRMAKRNLVARHDDPGDGRGARVVITEQGRAAIEAAAPGHVATVRQVFVDRLDARDKADLHRILGKLGTRPAVDNG